MADEELTEALERLQHSIGYLGEQIEGLRGDLYETRSSLSDLTEKSERLSEELREVSYGLDAAAESR